MSSNSRLLSYSWAASLTHWLNLTLSVLTCRTAVFILSVWNPEAAQGALQATFKTDKCSNLSNPGVTCYSPSGCIPFRCAGLLAKLPENRPYTSLILVSPVLSLQWVSKIFQLDLVCWALLNDVGNLSHNIFLQDAFYSAGKKLNYQCSWVTDDFSTQSLFKR